MVTVASKTQPGTHHAPLLHNPWFAAGDEVVSLHRYFDDQFVQRFVQEAMSGRLQATRDQGWYNSDRFGRTDDLPTLRLPSHQTFYIACCEISCDNLGLPAFDPKRIRSAGFVIRRRTTKDGVQRWMINEGQPLGWQGGVIQLQEPDDYRRFINSKLLQPQYPEPAYSGEETYPLHPLLVRNKESNGRQRSRTLLWGYVPLGGNYRISPGSAKVSNEATDALRQELQWPFGERNNTVWIAANTRPIYRGQANKAFYELLEALLLRYRIFDDNDDNREIRRCAGEINFYPPLERQALEPFYPYAPPLPETKGDTLLEWIENSRDALLEWLSNIATGKSSIDTQVPIQTGIEDDGSPTSSPCGDDLYIREEQAARLRDALLLRGGRAQVVAEEGLLIPRFGQSDDDRFFITPFVRWQDECGCEKIHWGSQGSIDFGVVSPLDPEAQRPRTIILPDLNDIKRGAAKGVTIMAPKSLANMLRKIKPDMDMGPGGPGNPAGLCWSFGLSIPVVTICAFILLMIIMNILNIIFRWLPWAFVAVPRLCKFLSEIK